MLLNGSAARNPTRSLRIWDKLLKLWDLDSGDTVAAFTCDSAARCCALDNIQTVVAGDEGSEIHFLLLEE